MKQIPINLLERLKRPTGNWAFLAKIVSAKNGEVFGFTTLDADITFDDGIDIVTYDSANELRPQNIQNVIDYDADNTELLGWFNQALEKKVLAGVFDRAEITIYRVSYLALDDGAEIVAFGTVGEVAFATKAKERRKVEYVSLRQQLKQTVNEMYSLTCRAQFGDERCKKPLVWENASVAAVSDSPYLKFRITGPVRPNEYFDFGVIEFLTGNNAGATLEVESWTYDGTLQLSFLAPYPVKNGDTLRIRRDCGKTYTDCMNYSNIPNMRAEPHTPVEDAGVMVPGAYIKSVNAK